MIKEPTIRDIAEEQTHIGFNFGILMGFVAGFGTLGIIITADSMWYYLLLIIPTLVAFWLGHGRIKHDFKKKESKKT